jgi:hypothetical protein
MTIKADRNSSLLAGEYFVAAELYRLGYSVAMTLGNAKAIDLFAEHSERTVNVQVKAIARRKNIGWPIARDKVMPGVVYVFVCLNEPPEAPTYFIATAEEARAKVKQYAVRGIIDLTSLRSDDFIGRWDKIEAALVPPIAGQNARRGKSPANIQMEPTPLAGSRRPAGPRAVLGS